MTAGKLVRSIAVLAVGFGAVWGTGLSGRLNPARPEPPGSASASTPEPKSRPGPVIAEGRVATYPGEEVVVGSETAGRIIEMPVTEKSRVRKGDLIAALRADDLRATRAEADARVAESDADIRYFETELRRASQLHSRAGASSSEVEGFRRSLDASKARRAAAQAAGAHIEALLAKTRMIAPIDGVVIARHAHPGEVVAAGARLVTVG